jgi:hypothetical protein
MVVSVSHVKNMFRSGSIAQQDSCVMHESTIFTRREHPFGSCMSYEFWIISQKCSIKSPKSSFFVYTSIVFFQSLIFLIMMMYNYDSNYNEGKRYYEKL